MGDIKNIIFDIGNVVIHWEPYEALKDYYENQEKMNEHLLEIGFFDWNIEQDRGRSIDLGLEQARKNSNCAHIFETYVKNLHLSHARQIPGTAEIIQNLANNRVPVYGLSNITKAAYAIVLETAPELNLLRHTTVSARVGMVKPEPGIFEYCLQKNGLQSGETLFVDDSEENCRTARGIGLHVHQFGGAEGLRKCIQELDLLK